MSISTENLLKDSKNLIVSEYLRSVQYEEIYLKSHGALADAMG
jgi:hypothetical protein